MAVYSLSLSANPGVLQFSPLQKLPMGYDILRSAGFSCLVNFSGPGVGAGGTPAVGIVTVQVSNDPNANSNVPALAAAARWNNHDILVGLTTDKNDSIAFAIAYVRLSGTIASGVVTLQVGVPDTSNPSAY